MARPSKLASAAAARTAPSPAGPDWWPPLYAEACRLLSIDPEADQRAAGELAAQLFPGAPDAPGAAPPPPRPLRPEVASAILRRLLAGRTVAVLGGAPRLRADLALLPSDAVLVATGGSLSLLPPRILPDVLVTDLDGDAAAHVRASARGALTVAHAHADNGPERRDLLPLLEGPVVGSAQPGPHPDLLFTGGFTDGDRAAALAARFGAAHIVLLGFDREPRPGHRDPARKRMKLGIARKVLRALQASGCPIEDPALFLQG